jgi:4-amino-4-deoxy-L-arabinose transferase-like glycosyltransferase
MDNRSTRSSSDARFAWLVAGGGVALAGALTLLATRHGVTVDQDSATYVSAARNLAAGRGYVDFTGSALTNFPPLFPSVIRAAMWMLPTATTAARWVNVLATAGSAVLAFFLIRRHARSRLIVAGATLVVATSIGLLHVADKASSEPLFWLLTIAFLLTLETVGEARGRRALLLTAGAGLLCGCAFLTRYAGVVLGAVGVVTILVAWWRARTPAVLSRLVTFGVSAAVLPALWLVRNANTDSPHLLGPRVGSGAGFVDLARQTAKSVGSVFLPQRLGRWSEALFWALVVVTIVGVIGLRRTRTETQGSRPTLVPIVAFVVLYIPFIAWTNVTAGTSLDFRTFSPVFVPVVVVFASTVDDIAAWSRRTHHDGAHRALFAGGAVLVLVLGLATVYDAWDLSKTAHGYSAPSVVASPLAHRVALLPANALVASNDPYRLYGTTGRQPVVLSPGVEGSGISVSPTPLDVLTRHAACRGPVYLAWWESGNPLHNVVAPAQLTQHASLTVVDHLQDGTLYSLEPSPGTPVPSC